MPHWQQIAQPAVRPILFLFFCIAEKPVDIGSLILYCLPGHQVLPAEKKRNPDPGYQTAGANQRVKY